MGGALFLLSTIVGGIRLLLLARRSRELPEFVLGTALFLMGGVATPLAALSRLPLDLPSGAAAACSVVSSLFMTLGCAGFVIFTQRVFRPTELWARVLAFALPITMIAGIATTALTGGYATANFAGGAGYYVFHTAMLVAIAWCAVESTYFANALARRVRIGLADPVVANRVRLWGSAMIVAALLSFAGISGQLSGFNLLGTLAGLTFVGSFGSLAAGAIYLAFLPPRAYTRWIATFETGVV